MWLSPNPDENPVVARSPWAEHQAKAVTASGPPHPNMRLDVPLLA
jgi:hypothetical protein